MDPDVVSLARSLRLASITDDRQAQEAIDILAEAVLSRPAMTYTGRMRVHFNRHGAAPLVWCIATDDWEMAVANVILLAPTVSMYRAKATPDDEDGRPSAWFEVEGVLVVEGRTATIRETK